MIFCFLLGHKWKDVGVSEYSYSRNLFSVVVEKQIVRKCSRCGKKDLPWWWDKNNRKLRPCVDVTGYPKKWKQEIKILRGLKK